MKAILFVLIILISVALVALIIVQNRGGSAGSVFGGGSSEIYRTRRGAEKLLHFLTIGLTFLFSVITSALIFIR